ncbi:2-dehydropantoate 2-reductase [Hydrogenophaga crassostreae]|uniref:2-dehydropantoate 2-reductase n=1 Tax=Hydrogenophaga crassostreae TaxID=1763535 RepID=A0A167GQW6_9BURK|nr:2-dehydropantoate 2-reductase [Hydrogenophaga crassostreae]OAD39775.1 2-dehydropantoate 2-reductase [Hydrogenophaga crassostreae]
MKNPQRIVPVVVPGSVLIMGAGSVGCYIGGCLQAAGVTVDFVGRPRVLDALRCHGLRITDLDGADHQLPPDALRLHEHTPAGLEPALVLLCVKSPATAQAAAELADQLPFNTLVLSMQNGLRNAEQAKAAAPGLRVLPGMVPYNIAELAPGQFHRGTTGHLATRDSRALDAWLPVFAAAGIPLDVHADLKPIQWGKLLLNLNNPVNALSGLPLLAELLDARHRRQFAALVKEALGVMETAGIRPARLTPMPWPLFVLVLRLPTPLFRRIAARMLRIDPKARSSMADDLALGRVTEIDALSGEVVRLAHSLGIRAPLNETMVARIRAVH